MWALSVLDWECVPQLWASSFPSSVRSSCHTGLSWMEQSCPVALLLKPQSCWHDKCRGANNSQTDDDPHHSLMVARVQQSTCRADWLEWQGWRVCVCVYVRNYWGEQTAVKIFAGHRGENLLPLVKAFPKKELSLFALWLDLSTWSNGSLGQFSHWEQKPVNTVKLRKHFIS